MPLYFQQPSSSKEVPLYYDDYEPLSSQYPIYSEPKRYWPARGNGEVYRKDRVPASSNPFDGRSFSLTVSSSGDGSNGVTMVTTTENGKTQTCKFFFLTLYL